LSPAIVVLAALASATLLFVVAPMARADCTPPASGATCPPPSPSPSPIPSNAFLSLDITDGGPNTQITVNGGAFLPNEHMTLYWDQPGKVAGSAIADQNGNFSAPNIKPFAGDSPGVHKLCASVAPNPCANFTLEATTTSPAPSPSPSASPSATPVATTTPTLSPTPVAATLNGFDVISRPPFVFLPLTGAFAILVSLIYWLVSVVRKPRLKPLPTAAVVHRATRPDYKAEFGAPPPSGAEPQQESAWAEPMPSTHPAPETPPAEPEPEPEPPAEPPTAEWDTGTLETGWGISVPPDTGYPELPPPEEPRELGAPDLPEPGD
jgi:hypothetical protein